MTPLPDPLERPLLRPDELVGAIPHLGRSAIYEAIMRGDIPSIRIGRRVYVPTAELRRRWLIDPTQSDVGATTAPTIATTDDGSAPRHEPHGTPLRAV